MEGKPSNIMGQHANRERKLARKREVSPPTPATAVLGYRAQNLQSRRNLLSKDIIFFPKNCNANPISILVCDHGSRVTYNIHTKFEHTVKAAARAWWTQDKKGHIHELPAAAAAPHWRGDKAEKSGGCTAAAPAGHLDRRAALTGGVYWAAARSNTLPTSSVNIRLRPFPLLRHLCNPDSKSLAKLCHRYKDCRKTTWNGAQR